MRVLLCENLMGQLFRGWGPSFRAPPGGFAFCTRLANEFGFSFDMDKQDQLHSGAHRFLLIRKTKLQVIFRKRPRYHPERSCCSKPERVQRAFPTDVLHDAQGVRVCGVCCLLELPEDEGLHFRGPQKSSHKGSSSYVSRAPLAY